MTTSSPDELFRGSSERERRDRRERRGTVSVGSNIPDIKQSALLTYLFQNPDDQQQTMPSQVETSEKLL
jgi:hypothetical protein